MIFVQLFTSFLVEIYVSPSAFDRPSSGRRSPLRIASSHAPLFPGLRSSERAREVVRGRNAVARVGLAAAGRLAAPRSRYDRRQRHQEPSLF